MLRRTFIFLTLGLFLGIGPIVSPTCQANYGEQEWLEQAFANRDVSNTKPLRLPKFKIGKRSESRPKRHRSSEHTKKSSTRDRLPPTNTANRAPTIEDEETITPAVSAVAAPAPISTIVNQNITTEESDAESVIEPQSTNVAATEPDTVTPVTTSTGEIQPNFIKINLANYNIRSSPHFGEENTDNIAFTTSNRPEVYPVSEVVPHSGGWAVAITKNQQKYWVYMPRSAESRHLELCEDATCGATNLQAAIGAVASGTIAPRNQSEFCEGNGQVSPSTTARRPTSTTNQAGCVADTRNNAKPSFRSLTNGERKRKFVAWATPYALEIQAATGLSASVVIAQASLETGYGSSNVFQRSGNIGGHSCFSYGKRVSHQIKIRGEMKTIVGECKMARPRNEGGYYLVFDSPQSSFYAYASLLMNGRAYRAIQADVRTSFPSIASFGRIIQNIGAYVGLNKEGYKRNLHQIIREHDLATLERKKLCV